MIEPGELRFNTTGPCFPNEHYMLDALGRLPDIEPLIASRLYFVLHAARQAGKTTAVKALVKKLNAAGKILAVYCSLEVVQGKANPNVCMAVMARQIADNAAKYPPFIDRSEELQPVIETLPDSEVGSIIRKLLGRICREAGKPVVFFFDEADCIPAHSIVSFLRQLRDGYVNRDEVPFPMSIALIGMRDIRDYKAQLRPDRETLGSASPFNIVKKALTLRNFTEPEVGELYAQHTAATGQAFTPEAVHRAFELSDGQPWIVNAIADECVAEIHKEDIDPVTLDDVNTAREMLIVQRCSLLNSIFKRLRTEWVVVSLDAIGKPCPEDAAEQDAIRISQKHGIVEVRDGIVCYSCPLVEQAIRFYLSGDMRFDERIWREDKIVDGKTIHCFGV